MMNKSIKSLFLLSHAAIGTRPSEKLYLFHVQIFYLTVTAHTFKLKRVWIWASTVSFLTWVQGFFPLLTWKDKESSASWGKKCIRTFGCPNREGRPASLLRTRDGVPKCVLFLLGLYLSKLIDKEPRPKTDISTCPHRGDCT